MSYEYSLRRIHDGTYDKECNDPYEWFADKYDYNEFLFRIWKPLRLDAWFTPEEINKIKQ